ncbi:2-dehydropantoate 2-reductase [Shewanella avicenniae]|uniref:2-dehydropantoate 2-reductase n=1 Tax=Shewanella avicenniae TaxID=2814294 RepID=A0ABX7QVF5_9GAMM|nr:2-dehydropantoate 2-reductase [Shewanella avicenniae]QSX34625.1 2-dehydropantoate 2-reductase [Shewanella avicenniae]
MDSFIAMNIAILGAGAIGQLLAHQLDAAGNTPFFLVKPEQRFLGAPFTLQTQTGTQARHFDTFSLADELQPKIDLLIVTLKAYQVRRALTRWQAKLSPNCHILLLHNGIGTHLEIAPILGQHGLSLGTTSQAALKLGPHSIKQTGNGTTQFGHYAGPTMAKELQQLLLKALPDSCVAEHILTALWHKLAINAVINPLTAIEDIPNGALAAEKYQHTISAVLTELMQVANLEGIELDSAFVSERVKQVISLTADNYSSMHQDVAFQRPTEIDYINGYLVQRAHAHGITLFYNQQLLTKVRQLSQH